jgi:arylsulfatase A-like enzyme
MAQPAPPPPPPTLQAGKSAPPTTTYVCVIVVDAARYDEFNLATMPNLAALAARGTQFSQAWVGDLPSVTETSHATIGTGVLPSRHMILGDTWRFPGTNSMSPNLLDSTLTRTGYIGNVIRRTGSPSLAALIHQRYPGSTVVTLSGHKVYAADALGAGSADFVAFGERNSLGHYVPGGIPGRMPDPSVFNDAALDLPTYPRVPGVEDNWTTTLTLQFLNRYHPKAIMVNLPEVDVFGHIAGTDSTVMTPLLENVDRQIGRVMQAYVQAGMFSRTTFVITADHGMVPALHTVSITTIDSIIKAAGGQPLYSGHGDWSTIWLKDTTKIPAVSRALASASIPYVDAVYAKSPEGKYQLISPASRMADPNVQSAYRDLLNSMNAAESADIVLFYDENTMTETPSFLKSNRKGDHGGATWAAQHIPLIVAGPGIKAGYISSFPARLVDIAPTLESLLGITPRGQDGVPVTDIMTEPPASAVKRAGAVAPRLLTDVRGLENEAAVRPNHAYIELAGVD